MASARHLPQKFNPLMTEEVPPYEVLVARRQLGHIAMSIKIGSGGVSNSIKTKKPGKLEYAYLRVPIPKGIVSGIFNPSPLSYYLMRRSSDGYINASGMFKASFPYATLVEEDLERKYIKASPATCAEEIAGNLWISPQYALELAEEYHITSWIRALLDNTPIETDLGNELTAKKIKPPPPFEIDKEAQPPVCQPRDRLRRSVSPSKNSLPSKVIGIQARASKAEINAKCRADTEDLSGKLNGPIPETLEIPIKTSPKSQENILLSIKTYDPIIENAPRTITHNQIDSNHGDHTCTIKEPVMIAHASKNHPPGVLNNQDKISPDIDGHTTSVPENSPDIESESVETTHAQKKSTSKISSDDENEPSRIVNDSENINTEDVPHIKSDLPVANEIFRDSETEVKLEVLPEIDVKTEVESIYSQSSSEVSKNESSSQDTENLISIAKKMVEDAVTDEKFELIPRKIKRKALELELVDMDEENIDESTSARVKRMKIEEKELKKEKIKNRALLGITATLAIGAVIQYAFNAV